MPLTDEVKKENAHFLAQPHTRFCQCMSDIHQLPVEVRRAALDELLVAVHTALEQLEAEENED